MDNPLFGDEPPSYIPGGEQAFAAFNVIFLQLRDDPALRGKVINEVELQAVHLSDDYNLVRAYYLKMIAQVLNASQSGEFKFPPKVTAAIDQVLSHVRDRAPLRRELEQQGFYLSPEIEG